MLLVKASAGPSEIHRLGLIARQFILFGTIVWKFEPHFDVAISESRFRKLSPVAQEQVIYYAYYHQATRTFVLSSDDDRFTNHSGDPNTRSRDDYTYAVRDIEEGQEITNDYGELVMLNFTATGNVEEE
jgi:SET domain-containing protein